MSALWLLHIILKGDSMTLFYKPPHEMGGTDGDPLPREAKMEPKELTNRDLAFEEIKDYCKRNIQAGTDGAEIARQFGNEERARGFESRSVALLDILSVMARQGIDN